MSDRQLINIERARAGVPVGGSTEGVAESRTSKAASPREMMVTHGGGISSDGRGRRERKIVLAVSVVVPLWWLIKMAGMGVF